MSSSASNPVFKIFEMDARLSKFCMFEFVEASRVVPPESYVQFAIKERVQRIAIWLEDRFNVAVRAAPPPSPFRGSCTCLMEYTFDGGSAARTTLQTRTRLPVRR